jgi:hypothetical protein
MNFDEISTLSSEMLVWYHNITPRHNPEGLGLSHHRGESLKTRIFDEILFQDKFILNYSMAQDII